MRTWICFSSESMRIWWSGRLSAERFDKLSSEYETEQKDVKAAILDLQELIDSDEQKLHDLQQFLKNVRKYTAILRSLRRKS